MANSTNGYANDKITSVMTAAFVMKIPVVLIAFSVVANTQKYVCVFIISYSNN